MVRRYPHTAIVTVEGRPKLVNGKRVSADSHDVEVHGRYDSDGKTVKRNELGKETIVQGAFYTKALAPMEGRAVRIQIASMGIDSSVIAWESFQTHSVISV